MTSTMPETRRDAPGASPGGTAGRGGPRSGSRWARRPRPWRHAVPTVLQMESVECGAASLAMILAHHGRHVPLEDLRGVCGVSRDGARASTLLSAARTFGLTARGYQTEADQLRDLAGPVIIFWAFQHFMVVEGIRTRYGRTVVAVNDPASGPRLMEWDEFDSGFTGIVLSFEKGPDFRPGGSRGGVGRALLERRLPTGRAMPLVLLASLLLVVPGIAIPAYTRVFIDRVLAGSGSGYLLPLLVAMALTSVAVFILTSVQRHYLLRLEIRMGLVSSARFFRHLLRLPVDFFLQRRPAEVAKRVAGNDMVAEILSRDLALTVINLGLVLFYAAILIRYDILLGVIGVGMALLNVVVLHAVSRARTDAVAALRTDRGNLTATTFTTLSLIETVKATGAEPEAFSRWGGFLAKVVSAKQKLGIPSAVLTVVPPMLAALNSGLILLVGGQRVVDGAMSVGLLVSFQTLLSALSRPVAQLTNLGGRLQDVTADIKRLYDVERYPVAACFATADPEATAKLDGTLEFENVGFSYSPLSEPVIKELSLTVVPGRRVAVVGGSGSGKSTLGRLLTGLYAPGEGRILLDGRPREEISRTVLATSLAYVDQDISLFEGTVRDNLTLWNDDVSDEAVTAALRDAAVFDTVMTRPGGVHSPVLEGGRNFSGGQRQRLELARALATEPTLLVLDEATSALDPETERTIMDNLRRRGCACLIIAHRLSTVRDADEIVVLQQGRIVERGTHEELLALGGHYTALIESSRREEEDEL
ncbi:NHLP family bacteriocin export ABC transporter peptidase/permease/ATPase subunit [Streptomyces griseochromogenes]|uniref:NHLP family bacteriocin export ABC transporter peptidase/permease/ATPase subunit n=2 Tax=Streptomyces griseochromogenes TaxID=68214 RepID=A0A1B1AP88_9ACTN|nr:NHLP family bacteriocin export ABC transporter peptidase/permease/ATPase subunit [Streptomyces griseochromogenes]ANP48398.1 NHLP family bacteriocin export ABC transporter peptidase/permease/ATPase subunit [Streptomyces griseochromogenes]